MRQPTGNSARNKISARTSSPRAGRRRGLRSFVVACIVAAAALGLASSAGAATITSAGPLTSITISPDLNCAVTHTGDTSPEWYGTTACGTLAVDQTTSTLYGPASIPAGGSASPRTAFTPISQTGPTGTGTSGDPYRIVTVVGLGASGLTITQTDTYVVGQESYTTDVQISNANATPRPVRLYTGGDCYLQNSDEGFGRVDGNAVACTTGTDPGSRIEQLFPLTSGSSYMEAGYSTIWAQMGAQAAAPNSCLCANFIDNGIMLSWDVTVPASGSVTVSHLTTFSPLGIVPLSTTKTADAASVDPGAADGYTITIHNSNSDAVVVNTITDTLPAGFTYTPGSTTGATTSDPTVAGQNLTWSGPFNDPAGGDVTLHFGVTVSSTVGTYYNNAGGSAETTAVAQTGDTAPVQVGGPTAVQMRSFTATPAARGILLRWRTGSEVELVGFNVFRQKGVQARKVKLNRSLVRAKGGVAGAKYSWLDRSAKRGGRYWLQAVNADGSRSWYGGVHSAGG